METVGYAMNASLNSKKRLSMKSGGLPSKNWIKCCVAPIANTAMWKSLIEGEEDLWVNCQFTFGLSIVPDTPSKHGPFF